MKWWNEQNKHRRGFTLLEVVAVVAMLGVLASMLLPSVETYVSRSRDMKLTADLSVVDSAIVLYRLDEGALPASLEALQPAYIHDQKLTDAQNQVFVYTLNTPKTGYTLSGKKTDGTVVSSKGSLVPEVTPDV